MAVPVIKGTKSANERFAGALETYCIEAMMQDGKALQAGTSHFLGQNFAKAFDVKFSDKDGSLNHVYATSWGVSTRLMGALIMTHSDDNGLVLPPKLAPDQVVIVPIYRTEQEYADTVEKGQEIVQLLRQKGIRVKLDARDTHKPGWKFNEYELKGVPIRIALGPKDLENKTIEVARRDTLSKELIPQAEAIDYIVTLLDTIQENLFQKAMEMRVSLTHEAEDYEQFKSLLEEKGGFIWAHWDGTPETEEQIKAETKATIRCIPIEGPVAPGKCILTGKDSSRKVLFARAY